MLDGMKKSPQPLSVTRKALLVGGSDQAFRRAVDDLVRLAARLQEVRGGLAARIGVTPPQYNIVMHLARHAPPEGLRLGAVAEALDVSLSFVVAETRRLHKQRLIAVRRDPADGRAMLASLAPAGRRALAAAAPVMQQVNDRLFAALSRAELLELGRLAAVVHADSAQALAQLGGRGKARPARPVKPK